MKTENILELSIYKLLIALSRNRSYSTFKQQMIRKRIIKLYLLYAINKRYNRQKHRAGL